MDEVGLSDAKMPSKKSVSFKKEQKEGTELLGSQASITLATSGEKTSGEKSQNEARRVVGDIEDEPKTKSGKDAKMRNVCLTLNNYSDEEYEAIIKAECSYLIVGKEVCPSTGTPHLQMYAEFSNGKTLTAIKKHFKTNRLHIESRRGTAKQASQYCMFEDYPENTKLNEYVEFGEISQQGARTDWTRAVQDLSDKSITDVVMEQPQLLPCIRALERYKQLSLEPIEREVEVIVLYGDAGSGKTRGAYTADPDLFSKPTGDWWDGYSGESTILLDDFYGTIKYCEFLKVLDRYKYRVPVKGGFVGARWNKVFITSNKHPSEWYGVGLTPALKRRINKVYHLILNEDGSTTQNEETLTDTISHRRMGAFYTNEADV